MLNRLLWVTDSGFNSATNRACLQCGRIHCIVCEKLRSARVDATAALSRPGRYHVVGGNVSVKEVRVGDGARAERFCVCVNPEAKARDAIVRKNRWRGASEISNALVSGAWDCCWVQAITPSIPSLPHRADTGPSRPSPARHAARNSQVRPVSQQHRRRQPRSSASSSSTSRDRRASSGIHSTQRPQASSAVTGLRAAARASTPGVATSKRCSA